jgi:thioredoxin-dependent peroxiredoxin
MLRLLLTTLFVTSLGVPLMADDTKLKVKEGDAFPAFELTAAQVEKVPGKKAGEKLSLKDLKGKNVVVFFYPKALTPGCTVESCGFRDLAEKFPKDAILIGASADTEAKQNEFIEKHKLPYALLCDTDLALIKALGIQSGKNAVPQRLTFVIDREGKITKIYSKVTPKDHPDEVLKYINALK